MGRRELGLHLCGTGDNDAVELQVTHRLGARCLSHQTVQQFVADRSVGILTDGSSSQN